MMRSGRGGGYRRVGEGETCVLREAIEMGNVGFGTMGLSLRLVQGAHSTLGNIFCCQPILATFFVAKIGWHGK